MDGKWAYREPVPAIQSGLFFTLREIDAHGNHQRMPGLKRKFTAKLGGAEAGALPLVEIPFDVKEAFGRARAPVLVSFKKFSFRTTVAVYGGRSYIGLRREVREAAGVELGETITFTLEADTAPRTVKVPKDLAAALRRSGVTDLWKKLSFTHQREHVSALDEAKKPETRAKRIEKTVAMLTAKAGRKT